MTSHTALFAALFTVLAVSACSKTRTEVDIPGSLTLSCRGAADCEQQAMRACPAGYDTAAAVSAEGRLHTMAVRCKG